MTDGYHAVGIAGKGAEQSRAIYQDDDGTWTVELDGAAVKRGLTNAQAWLELDRISGENLSASSMGMTIYSDRYVHSQAEKQDFYSGLIHVAEARGYKSGWAWLAFIEKFGHEPNSLAYRPKIPNKSVIWWVNMGMKQKRRRA